MPHRISRPIQRPVHQRQNGSWAQGALSHVSEALPLASQPRYAPRSHAPSVLSSRLAPAHEDWQRHMPRLDVYEVHQNLYPSQR